MKYPSTSGYPRRASHPLWRPGHAPWLSLMRKKLIITFLAKILSVIRKLRVASVVQNGKGAHLQMQSACCPISAENSKILPSGAPWSVLPWLPFWCPDWLGAHIKKAEKIISHVPPAIFLLFKAIKSRWPLKLLSVSRSIALKCKNETYLCNILLVFDFILRSSWSNSRYPLCSPLFVDNSAR